MLVTKWVVLSWMRRTTIGMMAAGAIAASGCGSSEKFANIPKPPPPINLTVYINDSRVSVSPAQRSQHCGR